MKTKSGSNETLIAADFETTVYEGQKKTEVWSVAYAELYSDKVNVLHSIDEFISELLRYRRNVKCWFHNLKFDGSFIVSYLLRNGWTWNNCRPRDLKPKEFTTLISGQNRWYALTIKGFNGFIKILDSVKLMPMSLEQMGKAFNTEHRKLTMKYEGERYAGCPITKEEMEYIINDVLVLKEALEIMLNDGHNSMTIGSCAMKEQKAFFDKYEYKNLFPDLGYNIPEEYGARTADEYIRRSYRGGYCYCKVKGKVGSGITYDVNSLYPSVMHSISGNRYPVGKPKFFRNRIPEVAFNKRFGYIVRFKCRFKLKKNHLPTVQIKGSPFYPGNEWLETSDFRFRGKYYRELKKGGEVVQARPTLTMTDVDYILFKEHYYTEELEILDGCYFHTRTGLFDSYIDKWSKIKKESEGGRRAEAKLFLNNLYGKYASSDDSSYRVPALNEEGALEFELVEEHEKELNYILVGTYVTSFARDFTIRHGQRNYKAFCYADTDSLHLLESKHKGIDVHPSDLLKWKLEGEWSSAIFIRQKTYAEFIRKKDGKKVYPRWNITCAGMPERCKDIFLSTHPITDFKPGLMVRGKLVPRQIPGGVILEETTFTLKHKTI